MTINNNCVDFVTVNNDANKLQLKAIKKCKILITVSYKAYKDKQVITLNNITNE